MAFKAHYNGKCKLCPEPILRGQEVTWIRSKEEEKKGYVHLSCYLKSKGETSPLVTETREETKGEEREISTLDLAQCSSARWKELASLLDEEEDGRETTSEETADVEVIIPEKAPEMPSRANGNGQDKTALDLMADSVWTRIESRVKDSETKFDATISEYLESELGSLKTHIDSKLAELTQATRVTVEVKAGDTVEVRDCGLQHKLFPLLLKMMQARDHRGNRLNLWIAGPAGTGKTSAVEEASKALGLPFASTGALVESYKVFGFMSPGTGAYIRTLFRDIWENGGVYLFDDCDGSDPAVMVELNNFLANGTCAFPDAQVKRHPDCVLVLTANTWGLGATNDYVGRMKQDAAFLDRFVRLFWPIDEDLELATSGNQDWTRRVQEIRHRVKEKGIKVLVTPRASYYGAALLQTGMSQGEVETAVLKAAMTDDQWESVRS